MTTANELRSAGVMWAWVDGALRADLSRATDETRRVFTEELARRKRAISDRACELNVPFARARLLDAPTERWGRCETCGDPIDHFRGGQCMLCIAAIRALVREKSARS